MNAWRGFPARQAGRQRGRLEARQGSARSAPQRRHEGHSRLRFRQKLDRQAPGLCRSGAVLSRCCTCLYSGSIRALPCTSKSSTFAHVALWPILKRQPMRNQSAFRGVATARAATFYFGLMPMAPTSCEAGSRERSRRRRRLCPDWLFSVGSTRRRSVS